MRSLFSLNTFEMTYKLIAIDLDGTLLAPDGRVSPRTKSAVHGVLRAGATVCFATGRNWNESRRIFESVEHLDLAVTVGGAVIMDAVTGRIVHRQKMAGALAAEVCGLLEGIGEAVLALQDHEASDVDYLVSSERATDASIETWLKMTASTARRVSDLAEQPHEHTLRLSIVAPPERVAIALEQLTARIGDRIVFHNIAVPGNAVEVLEIFDPSVNKWSGLQHVAKRTHIRPEEIIAVGDDLNDLHMLRAAGLGVAMGNAHPQAKAAAKRTIGSNAEDGLAVFLEELVATNRIARTSAA